MLCRVRIGQNPKSAISDIPSKSMTGLLARTSYSLFCNSESPQIDSGVGGMPEVRPAEWEGSYLGISRILIERPRQVLRTVISNRYLYFFNQFKRLHEPSLPSKGKSARPKTRYHSSLWLTTGIEIMSSLAHVRNTSRLSLLPYFLNDPPLHCWTHHNRGDIFSTRKVKRIVAEKD